ncbi:MAG: cob(I)yrinic acid a,c-diamide adenosyltransferase [Bacteroidales bacterium]|nr:cob(I)yrinic acid a,c-diamide adenosyltransferase [Bacteroidales bacterium]MCF8398999.1 cob(I)yrinic acid a,c-diamide adenosyltransferase [Bacteroidales bacterium]
MNSKMNSCIHIYTGNGKGKTTAAFGQALRAAGAGMKVYIAQFVKGLDYSEIAVVRKNIPQIRIEQFGRGCFIVKEPAEEDIKAARRGLEKVKSIVHTGNFDMVVLDEIFIALFYKLFSIEEVIEILENKPDKLEVIMTGRYAPAELIELADLVTEMKEVKHYYQQGVEAREGIEF